MSDLILEILHLTEEIISLVKNTVGPMTDSELFSF